MFYYNFSLIIFSIMFFPLFLKFFTKVFKTCFNNNNLPDQFYAPTTPGLTPINFIDNMSYGTKNSFGTKFI